MQKQLNTKEPRPKKPRLCTHNRPELLVPTLCVGTPAPTLRVATSKLALHPSSFIPHPSTARPRPAYTLLEILLVLAIIVMATAAVAPSLGRVTKNTALKSAASDVRAELTRAHVQAMRTGRIQAFQYELGGRKFKIQPWIGDDDALESNGSDPNTQLASQPQTDGREPGERSLPEAITFALGDAAIESRSERIEQELSSTSGTTWSRPILFFPDGSTSDAFLVVANDRDVGIRLDLRGLTGAVRISDLKSLAELETAAQASP